jgi:hypothetical protein
MDLLWLPMFIIMAGIIWGIAYFIGCIIEGGGLVFYPINFIVWLEFGVAFDMACDLHGLYQNPPPTFSEFALYMLKLIIHGLL